MSRRNRRASEAVARKGSQTRSLEGEVAVVAGPFTERQALIVQESGHRSVESYRMMLERLRMGNGAQRMLESARDWRVFMPMPPTFWVVEKDHFRGYRMLDRAALDRVRLGARRGMKLAGQDVQYPGSVMIYLGKNERDSIVVVEFLFEHDGLELQERYTFEQPETWRVYQRATSAAPWEEIGGV